MITANVIDLFVMLLMALLDSLPETQVPEWVTSGATFIPQIFQFASSLGVWVPWGLISQVMFGVVAVWLVAFGIKIVRIVISHLTGGGGSAA